MKDINCQNCEQSGVVFSEEVGVEYCPCPIGWEKEFADMKSALNQKFTTI